MKILVQSIILIGVLLKNKVERISKKNLVLQFTFQYDPGESELEVFTIVKKNGWNERWKIVGGKISKMIIFQMFTILNQIQRLASNHFQSVKTGWTYSVFLRSDVIIRLNERIHQTWISRFAVKAFEN